MRRKGSVIVLLLWILVGLSIMAMSFTRMVRVEANTTSNSMQITKAYYLARAGINYTIYKLLVYRFENAYTGNFNEMKDLKPRDIDLGKVVMKTDYGNVTVKISDENGKINVNLADKETLYNLMLALGTSEEQADIISDSILDWRDPDNNYRPNGAESDYYLTLNPPYMAKNGKFNTVEELLLVRGITRDLFYGRVTTDENGKPVRVIGLNKCLTVYGNGRNINVNTAPPPVLLAIGFPPDIVRQIVEERKVKPFLSREDFTNRIPQAPGMQMLKSPIITRPPIRSAFYSLISTAKIKNSKIKKTIFTIIKYDAFSPIKVRTIYWNENYFIQE